MKLGAAGKALIQSFEQCRLTAYMDGGGVWTIGWGHTGREVHEGLTCTQEQADAWFDQDVAVAVNALNKALDVAVNQNQFDALVSFTFNVGVRHATQSTLLRDVNAKRFAEAADEFPKWCHDNGETIPGLLRRRRAEQALFRGVSPEPAAAT